MRALGALFLVLSTSVYAADKPAGFENAAIYDAVMAGEIHESTVVDTKKESRRIFRAFFPKTSPEAFSDLATNHAKFPEMFPEILEGRTTKVNADRTEFESWMKVHVKVGPFSKTLYPEARQKIKRGADAISEWTMESELLNQKDSVEFVRGKSRLIPWEGGILIYLDSHFLLLQQAGLGMIKKKMMEQERRELEAFRKVLVPKWWLAALP